jgi:hypothetical protein
MQGLLKPAAMSLAGSTALAGTIDFESPASAATRPISDYDLDFLQKLLGK